MSNLYNLLKIRFNVLKNDNSGVTAIEIILILVVLIGLVIIFKAQAVSLVSSIWESIRDGASEITG
ncbi:MAG: hypothetical protein K6E10_03510 [Eubacterium sp.]|nr:hypothetical protein [Eubacterium sp.]